MSNATLSIRKFRAILLCSLHVSDDDCLNRANGTPLHEASTTASVLGPSVSKFDTNSALSRRASVACTRIDFSVVIDRLKIPCTTGGRRSSRKTTWPFSTSAPSPEVCSERPGQVLRRTLHPYWSSNTSCTHHFGTSLLTNIAIRTNRVGTLFMPFPAVFLNPDVRSKHLLISSSTVL